MKTRRNQYKTLQSKNQETNHPNTNVIKTSPPKSNLEPENLEQPTSQREDELTDKLNQLYEDVKSAPSFSAKIEEFLKSNELHSKYRQIVKRKFPRRRIVTRFPFELFQADLIEYSNRQYKYQNKNYIYCLVIIDCFSKFVWVKPMKTKSGKETAHAFDDIFRELDQHPINLITDSGLEFFNSKVAQVFSSYNIVHYKPPTKTDWKASIAERVIQTIKRRLQKYFHKYNTKNWINVINQVVSNYNNTPHRSHGFKPVDVTEENREDAYKAMFPNRHISVVCKLFVGDRVRKIREKTLFEKGYTQNWSDEIYIIYNVRQSRGVCWYKLKTLNQEEVPGIWYYYQLYLVSRNVDSNQGQNIE